MHYWALVDYAGASGDLAALKAASAPSCETCKTTIEAFEHVHAEGARIVSAPTRVTVIGAVSEGTFDQVSVTLKVEIPAFEEWYGEGDERNVTEPEQTRTERMRLIWDPARGTWVVHKWDL